MSNDNQTYISTLKVLKTLKSTEVMRNQHYFQQQCEQGQVDSHKMK